MQKHSAYSRKFSLIGIMLLIAAIVFGIVRLNTHGRPEPLGETAQQRLDYIRSFGWNVGTAPSGVKEIRIPVEFDEAYEQYNDIQRRQGFDLRKYRACRAKMYTYSIINSPEASPVALNANLIVYEGRIIGADISTTYANGPVTVLAKSDS